MAFVTPDIIVGRASVGIVNVISTSEMRVSAVNAMFIQYSIRRLSVYARVRAERNVFHTV